MDRANRIALELRNSNEGKLVSSRGGRREGAGRPSTGRRKRSLYITEEEYDKLKEYIKKLRENE